jgi:hypothetical protein
MNVDARSSIGAERKIWVDVDGAVGCTAGGGDRERFRDMAIVRMLLPCLGKAFFNASRRIECAKASFHITTRGHGDQATTNTVCFSILRWLALQAPMIVKGPYNATLRSPGAKRF